MSQEPKQPSSVVERNSRTISNGGYAIGIICIILGVFLSVGLFMSIPKAGHALYFILKGEVNDPLAKAEIVGNWVGNIFMLFTTIFLFKYGSHKVRKGKLES